MHTVSRAALAFFAIAGTAALAEPLHVAEHHHDLWNQIHSSDRLGQCLPPEWRPWDDYGIKVEGSYIGQGLWNLQGGLGQGPSPAWLNLGDLYVEWSHQEGAKGLSLPPGGQLGVHFLWFTDNGNFSAEEIGSWQPLRSAEASDFAALEEAWYRQSFADDQLWLKLGKFEPYNEISFSETAANFSTAWYTSLGNAPLPTYPWTGLGGLVGVKLPQDLTFQALVMMNGTDSETYSGFNHRAFQADNGATAVAELGWEPELAANHPTSLKIGGWYANATFDSSMEQSSYDDKEGGYLVLDQRLVNLDEGSKTIDAFAKLSLTPSCQNPMPAYWAAGALFSGWIPQRPQDDIGLAVSTCEFSADVREGHGFPAAESVVEMFYCCHVTECFFFRPTLSYVRHPAEAVAQGKDDQAWVVGATVEMSF